MTDESDVTGSEEPTMDQRVNILEDAVGHAHRRLNGLAPVVQSHEVQVIMLGFGVVLLALALLALSREGVTDGPGS